MAEFPSPAAVLAVFLTLLSIWVSPTQASDPVYISGTDSKGVTRTLLDSRYPSLYTGDFGDCMGGQSLLNLTAFDAAYYADNMTVLFHVQGTTNLDSEIVMLYISVDAYGEDRFDLAFDPCTTSAENTLCPMNSSKPISNAAIIPVSNTQVAAIQSIALVIPDFEGVAILRFFSNATKTQIGCFQAVMKNGSTLSHPTAVGSVLAVFTVIALVASFVTVIYGTSIPRVRLHYAHSLSVLLVFEVFQSIFFSGTLSLNWPSICAGWWSNFAWAGGMISSKSITNTLNSFIGATGNSSQVGGAGSSVLNNNGGQQIYGRDASRYLYDRSWETPDTLGEGIGYMSQTWKRASASASNITNDYSWNGYPVSPGLPLPGNWSGFAGELSEVHIPVANAFLTGFLWFLILIAVLFLAIVLFRGALQLLKVMNWIREDRLSRFQSQWLSILGLVVLRSMLIAFFMMMTLTIFQFASGGTTGAIAIAAIVFIIFFVGTFGTALYACLYSTRVGRYQSSPDRVHFMYRRVFKIIPWYKTVRASQYKGEKGKLGGLSLPCPRVEFVENETDQGVHEDVEFNKRFGWLSARYRRSRWWFFAFWVVYQFVRACFIGGARNNPTAQVYGLFVWELISFAIVIMINPFESARNTALGVWMLGIMKVVSSGLSIAFLEKFNLARIPATVVGVFIVVTQGLVVIAMMILIVLGAISSYMSLTRNSAIIHPRGLESVREKYFKNIELKATDRPIELAERVASASPSPVPEQPQKSYFNVNTVRREPKIEDEDGVTELVPPHPSASQISLGLANRTATPLNRGSRSNSLNSGFYPAPPTFTNRASRTPSMSNSVRNQYGSLPYGARAHRASWSSRDFQNWREEEGIAADGDGSPSALPAPPVIYGVRGMHSRSNSITQNTNAMRYSSSRINILEAAEEADRAANATTPNKKTSAILKEKNEETVVYAL